MGKGSGFGDDSLEEYFKGDASIAESTRKLSLELSRLGTEHSLGRGVSR
jgi:hypothetical protein